MNPLVPSAGWYEVIVQPWVEHTAFTVWTVTMGFLVAACCGLVGNYLLLRRMALVGDAISHSLLPGLVLVFVLTRSISTPWMMVAAVATGVLTVAVIEWIHRQSRVKPDVAICITFTSFFAMGVLLLSAAEARGPVHLDTECVLLGEIAYVALEPPLSWGGVEWGPPSVLRMGGVLALVVLLMAIFYKELLITSFDPGYARSVGMRTGVWHYGLMAVLSVVIVSAFEAVGAILAVAMVIVPPMAAQEMADRLPGRLVWTVVHAGLSALAGFHLSIWLNCSTAGAMVVAGAALFVLAGVGRRVRKRLQGRSFQLSESVYDEGYELSRGNS